MGQPIFPEGVALRVSAVGSGLTSLLLYVADSNNHRVQVFDANSGAHVRSGIGGGLGYGVDQLNTHVLYVYYMYLL